ncbi:MAG: hypothetical protein C0621_09885 [Desulfuromonas sp.]|nr:MAG: hypothetical protein C0621_09885 [Desulfuromonas sp.]
MIRSPRLLLILSIVFVAAMIYAYMSYPRQQRVTVSSQRVALVTQTPQTLDSEKTVESQELDLTRLARKASSSTKAKRDLFSYRLPAPVVKDALPPSLEPVSELQPETKPVPVVSPPPPPAASVRSVQIVFLGFLEKEGGRHVFLSADNDLFVVRPGEEFGHDRELTLISMSPQSLVISQKGRDKTIDVSLSEHSLPEKKSKSVPSEVRAGGGSPPPYKGHPPF